MRHFCKDLPMIQYNPSRHHQKALSKHIQDNSEVKYLEPVKDEEMPLPKKSSRKRKASGIFTTKEPPKYRTVVIKKRVPMRKAMLDFLNEFHKGTNGDAEYVLPEYLTEKNISTKSGDPKSDENNADVKAFGEEDL